MYSTWSDPENGTVTLSVSHGTVVKHANGTWSWSWTPSTHMFNETITITASDGTHNSTVSFSLTAFSVIQATNIFYNHATGANLSSSGAAQNAIDTSKSVLRTPGATSSFANYTNYSRGLNGSASTLQDCQPPPRKQTSLRACNSHNGMALPQEVLRH